jgi:hypothetical protein
MCLLDQRGETVCVDILRVDAELISVSGRDEYRFGAGARQLGTQAQHVGAQRHQGATWRRLAPQVVNECGGARRPSGTAHQRGQQPTARRSADRNPRPVRPAHL